MTGKAKRPLPKDAWEAQWVKYLILGFGLGHDLSIMRSGDP